MGVFCICSLKNAIAVEQIKSEILELSIEGHIYEKAPNQGENEAIKELDAGGVSGRFNPNSEILNTGSIQGEEIPYLIIAD